MSSRTEYIIELLLLLICVYTAASNVQRQYFNLFQSLSDTTTSFTLPITYHHNQWIISSSQLQCADQNENENNIIPLSIFFTEIIQHKNTSTLNIQLHIILFPNASVKQILHLYGIIYSLPRNTIHITTLIISHLLLSQSNIIQLITSHNIPITAYLDPLPLNASNSHRNLLFNISNTNIDINIEKESWLCKPWPIYISFFSGIAVTVVITLSIKFSMGSHDDDLSRALEKVVHAGIGNDANEDENEYGMDLELSNLQIHPPTKPTTYKSATSPQHTPTFRSKRALTELSLAGHLNQQISLSDNFNISPRHNRKVTFADEKKEKVINVDDNDVKHSQVDLNKKNKFTFESTTTQLPGASRLFNIPSAASVNRIPFENAASASMSSTCYEEQSQDAKEDEHSMQIGTVKLTDKTSVESHDDIVELVYDDIDNVGMHNDPCIESDDEEP